MVNLHQTFYTESQRPIAFIGDVHLNQFTPSSRVDDYPKTCVEKLRSLLNLCKLRRVQAVVMTGDVFHQSNQSVPFLLSLSQVFQEFQSAGVRLYSIIGNHDIKNELIENIERSPLGLFYTTNQIIPLGTLLITKDGAPVVQIRGAHFGEPLEPKQVSANIKSILVAHVFYNQGLPQDNLEEKDAARLGHDAYVLGHDHVPYDQHTINSPVKQVVIRPGSFMRASSHEYNVKDRKVWVDLYDPEQDTWTRDALFIKPPEEVFSASVLDKVDAKEVVEDLESKFHDLVNSLYSYDLKQVSVYQILDALTIDLELKSCIEQYLYANGIVRS